MVDIGDLKLYFVNLFVYWAPLLAHVVNLCQVYPRPPNLVAIALFDTYFFLPHAWLLYSRTLKLFLVVK